MTTTRPPSAPSRADATERLASLATPAGALGRLGELAIWWSSVTGEVPPPPLSNVRAVVFAGDHGVSAHGVSAYPSSITAAMVASMHAGGAGVSVLARLHGVALRVIDVAVDAEPFDALDPAISAHRIRRGSGAIHLEDALTRAEAEQAFELGARIAREEIAAGAQLLISGDMGIGNTTPACAVVAAILGLDAASVVGRGTGIDDATLAHKIDLVQRALDRNSGVTDPLTIVTALGSADITAAAGYYVEAAHHGVPLLVDGLISTAAAVVATSIDPIVAEWCAAGHRSTEPAHAPALAWLGLTPLLDLDLRLGEGSGAVAAVPIVAAAAALLRETALLSDLM